jgi:hypothetical protein
MPLRAVGACVGKILLGLTLRQEEIPARALDAEVLGASP